ncbi:molybdenum cofactor guanylyltransferase [Arthrobacter pullicola]|uniref:molybdenum cofactor guanylyltransferase n=1 Tax=Arthrobacter pullicola TaxID=2762224 RepID=UPI001CD8E8FF|nr:NTP transferase domain-containing protein [Arthrobacter pullicola]
MERETEQPPAFNAVVLAGGRSSRLGGVPKAGLLFDGQTLLERTLGAVRQARSVAIAGPADLEQFLPAVPQHGFFVREEPAFSGPAAAVGAAVSALYSTDAAHGSAPPWTMVLACDMPGAAGAVQTLLAEAGRDPGQSVMARDSSGALQPLAALYRTEDLRSAVIQQPGGLENLSMFRLLARVQWREVAVPEGSTADVDTWADAGKWGIRPGNRTV